MLPTHVGKGVAGRGRSAVSASVLCIEQQSVLLLPREQERRGAGECAAAGGAVHKCRCLL